MAQRDGALGAVAKAHGGDGVLIKSDAVQYLGTFTIGNASTALTNTLAFTQS
jgi:hypothetical protein